MSEAVCGVDVLTEFSHCDVGCCRSVEHHLPSFCFHMYYTVRYIYSGHGGLALCGYLRKFHLSLSVCSLLDF